MDNQQLDPSVEALTASPLPEKPTQPEPPVAKEPPVGYTGPWPALYKDEAGNPSATPTPYPVDQGDPTNW